MFCVNQPYPDGWNRVRISDIKPRQVGTENVLALFVKNREGYEKMFYIFLNNVTLVRALVLKTLGPEGFNRNVDEEELKDKEIMIFLQPKNSFQIIRAIKGCEEDNEEFTSFSGQLF